jgi:hypothetical protein
MVDGKTRFTRRIGGYVFPTPTITNGYSSLVNNWHKGICGEDVFYHFARVAGPDHEPQWEAVPTSE